MSQQGYIKLHRKIRDNWVWKKSRYAHAWVELLLRANHKPNKVEFEGEIVTINTGEHITTHRDLARDLNWNKNSVGRFLKLLEQDGMIYLKSGTKASYIFICNYETYQHKWENVGTMLGQSWDNPGTILGLNNNDKNDKNEENDKKSLPIKGSDDFTTKDFLTYFCKRFKEYTGEEYEPSPGKDHKLLKDLADKHGARTITTRTDYFFDEYVYVDELSAKSPTVGMLKTKWNAMSAYKQRGRSNKAKPEYSDYSSKRSDNSERIGSSSLGEVLKEALKDSGGKISNKNK